MSIYKVELTNGQTINVPRDAARSKYESIAVYGISAVLERVKRTRAYKAAAAEGAQVRAVIRPSGEVVTHL